MKSKIKIPIYRFQFTLYIGDVDENIEKVEKQYNVDISHGMGSEAYTCELVNTINQSAFFMFLPEDVDISTLSHECLHMTWFLLDFAGVEVGPKNHEAQAYLLGYITKQVDEKLRKNNKISR